MSIGVSIVVILALVNGVPGWTRKDKACLAGAALGIGLWWASSNALFGLLISQIVIFLGAWPTFEAAAKNPKQESRLAWTLYWIGAFLGVVSIPIWTLASAAQPVTFLAVETVMMYLLYRPQACCA